jgi:hypothetical protein
VLRFHLFCSIIIIFFPFTHPPKFPRDRLAFRK